MCKYQPEATQSQTEKESVFVLPQMRLPACDVRCSCGTVEHLEMRVPKVTEVTPKGGMQVKDTQAGKQSRKANLFFSSFNSVVFLLFGGE